MTKLFALALTFAAVLSFGQDNIRHNQGLKTLDKYQAAQAWATINIPEENLPPITGGGIVEETLANNGVRQAVAVYSQPGLYMIRGVTCSGLELKTQFSIESAPAPGQGAYSLNMYNSQAMADSFWGLGSLCYLSMFRYHLGRVEGVNVNYESETEDREPKVIKEEVNGEDYGLTLEFLPNDAVVIIGRNSVGEIRPTLGKSTVWFKQPWWTNGLTSVTVCSKDRCSTSTYKRKLYPGGTKVPKG